MPLIQALLPVSTSQPLLLSFLCMTVILPRMDRVLFIKGFEMFDMGKYHTHFMQPKKKCYLDISQKNGMTNCMSKTKTTCI